MLPGSSVILIAWPPTVRSMLCFVVLLKPADSTSSLYAPGVSPEIVNLPSGPVSTRCDVLVLILVIVTAAFATGEPDGVVTVPEKLPPATCAQIIGTHAAK